MKKLVMLVLVVALCGTFAVRPVRAMDPITIALLAPIAMKVADAAKPYLIKAGVGTMTGLFKIGKDVFQMLYLPWGLLEMSFGAPFHKFHSGMVHVVRGGAVAPIRLMLHLLILPVYMTGAQVNI